MAVGFSHFFALVLFTGAALGATRFVLMLSPATGDYALFKPLMAYTMSSTDPEVQKEYDAFQTKGSRFVMLDMDTHEFVVEDFSEYNVVGVVHSEGAEQEKNSVPLAATLTRSAQVTYAERTFTTQAAIAVFEVEQDRKYQPKNVKVDPNEMTITVNFGAYAPRFSDNKYLTTPLAKTTTPPIKLILKCTQDINFYQMRTNGIGKYVDPEKASSNTAIANLFGLKWLSVCADATGEKEYALEGKLPLIMAKVWYLTPVLEDDKHIAGIPFNFAVGTEQVLFFTYKGITLERRVLRVDALENGKVVAEFESPCEVIGGQIKWRLTGDDYYPVRLINFEVECARKGLKLDYSTNSLNELTKNEPLPSLDGLGKFKLNTGEKKKIRV